MAAAHPHPRVTPDAEDACCDSLLRKKARMVSGFFSQEAPIAREDRRKILFYNDLSAFPKF
ncbi:hypothetical protein HMPREF3036_02352 [Sutterella sp. KLE1602]|nr:hypothetical protein HMPREF3036_02352 [Sutterella sp. KLE1602]